MDKSFIDLNKTIFELTSEEPSLIPLMAEIGFTEILKPIMLKTVGKIMTLPKGCAMRNIELDEVIHTLEKRGYEVINRPQKE